MKKVQTKEIIKFILSLFPVYIFIIGVGICVYYQFFYNPFEIQEKTAVEYVSQKYGQNYEITSVTPNYSYPMPFGKHLNYVTVEFEDKNNQEPNFRVIVSNDAENNHIEKVTMDYYYSDRYELLYNQYIDQLFEKNGLNMKYTVNMGILKNNYFNKLYKTYDEMVSDTDEIKLWTVAIDIKIYDDNDAEKYKCVYSFYKELQDAEYKEINFDLVFVSEQEKIYGWYSNMEDDYETFRDKDDERSIDHFFSNIKM